MRIALALRADCPIYVAEQVMPNAKTQHHWSAEGQLPSNSDGWLEGLNDEDLGPLQDVAVAGNRNTA